MPSKMQVRVQKPYIYIICNKENNIALWIDGSNTLKVYSVNQVPYFSINNKPMTAHCKSQTKPHRRKL